VPIFTSKTVKLSVVTVLAIAIVIGGYFIWVPLGTTHPSVNQNEFGVAISGYDPVAYFTESRPVRGRQEHEYSWHGARWHFASAENRQRFAAQPERYAPQFGGF
jgi:YHS domain-containing protein